MWAVVFAAIAISLLCMAVVEPMLRWFGPSLALFLLGMSAKRLATSSEEPSLGLLRAAYALLGLSGLVVFVAALATMQWVPALLTAFAAFCWMWMCGWAVWSMRASTPRDA